MSVGAIVRQLGGRGLFAAYDPKTGVSHGRSGTPVAAPGPAAGQLPRTGSGPVTAIVGVVLLSVGLTVGRRRRSAGAGPRA